MFSFLCVVFFGRCGLVRFLVQLFFFFVFFFFFSVVGRWLLCLFLLFSGCFVLLLLVGVGW